MRSNAPTCTASNTALLGPDSPLSNPLSGLADPALAAQRDDFEPSTSSSPPTLTRPSWNSRAQREEPRSNAGALQPVVGVLGHRREQRPKPSRSQSSRRLQLKAQYKRHNRLRRRRWHQISHPPPPQNDLQVTQRLARNPRLRTHLRRSAHRRKPHSRRRRPTRRRKGDESSGTHCAAAFGPTLMLTRSQNT